jgi:hypothetical protein
VKSAITSTIASRYFAGFHIWFLLFVYLYA